MHRLTVDSVLRTLKRAYPNAKCSLDWTTPLELLIATMLSAQCTDKRVNIVTKTLFATYKKPQDYLRVPIAELAADIRSCGHFNTKTRAIRETCQTLLDRFDGHVPKTMEEMITLRGVGRKTASVVLSTAFGIEEGIPVDTHCIRLSRRLGLTRQKQQTKIEIDLMRKTPRNDWSMLSHVLVAHGRAVCIARNRQCEKCVFKIDCPSSTVMGRSDKA